MIFVVICICTFPHTTCEISVNKKKNGNINENVSHTKRKSITNKTQCNQCLNCANHVAPIEAAQSALDTTTII